jgi:hypothetical protein
MQKFAALLGLLLCPAVVLADPILVTTGPINRARVDIGGALVDLVVQRQPILLTDFFSDGSTSLIAVREAVSRPGELRALASATLTAPTNSDATVFADATFLDNMLIEYQPSNGRIGFMAVGFTLRGFNSGLSSAFVFTSIFNGTSIDSNQHMNFFDPVTNGLFFYPELFPFRIGEWFNFQFTLGTVAPVNDNFSNGTTATADFRNTLTLSRLLVFGPDMEPIPNPIFSSGSGARYSRNGVVPEPSTVLLLLTGLVLTLRGKLMKCVC